MANSFKALDDAAGVTRSQAIWFAAAGAVTAVLVFFTPLAAAAALIVAGVSASKIRRATGAVRTLLAIAIALSVLALVALLVGALAYSGTTA